MPRTVIVIKYSTTAMLAAISVACREIFISRGCCVASDLRGMSSSLLSSGNSFMSSFNKKESNQTYPSQEKKEPGLVVDLINDIRFVRKNLYLDVG